MGFLKPIFESDLTMTCEAYAVGKKSRGVDMRGAYLAKIEEKKVRWRGKF
jgi:hypothetical protein